MAYVHCHGPAVDSAAKIQIGDHVFIEGELTDREYDRTVETDSSPVKVPWPVSEVVIEAVSVLERTERQEARSILAYLKATPFVRNGKLNTELRHTIDGKFKKLQEHFENYSKAFSLNKKMNLVQPLRDQVKAAVKDWQTAYKMLS